MFKGIVIGPINFDKPNGYLTILVGQFFEKRGGAEAWLPSYLFGYLKKGTRTFNFRSSEPSTDILEPLDQYDHY